jgi:hypothetical protein
MAKRSTPSSVKTLIERTLEYNFFTTKDDRSAPIRVTWLRGKSRKLAVVIGENATGKSLLRRLVGIVCRDAGVEFMPVSMEGRKNLYMGSFVYGDEETRATGQNSAQTVLTGIKTCRGRDSRHCIFWDEPDLGMSSGYAAGAGQAIAELAKDAPDNTVGIFVVSHSKPLVRQLMAASPQVLYCGEENIPASLEAWLDREERPRSLEDLCERSWSLFGALQKVMNANKAKKAKKTDEG